MRDICLANCLLYQNFLFNVTVYCASVASSAGYTLEGFVVEPQMIWVLRISISSICNFIDFPVNEWRRIDWRLSLEDIHKILLVIWEGAGIRGTPS